MRSDAPGNMKAYRKVEAEFPLTPALSPGRGRSIRSLSSNDRQWNLKFLWSLALGVWSLSGAARTSLAQEPPSLPAARYLHGEETLRAFAPISQSTRESIVKFNVDGETVALGTILDTDGLALTKASEIKAGK